MPAGYGAFKDLQSEIRDSYASILVQEGVFSTPVDDLTLYVRKRTRDGELRGILVHDARDPDRPTTLMAERGLMTQTDEGPRFILINGNRQEIDKESDQLSLLYFDRYAFTVSGLTGIPSARFREAKERYLPDLLDPQDTNEEGHRREFMAEAHNRLVSPLHSIVFVLIALAALLSGEFNRRGNAVRILTAVGGAILFQALAFGLASLLVRVPAAAVLLYLLDFVVGAAALYLIMANPYRRHAARPAAPPAMAQP
jgi:lipopolysaccharide export system permease protein